MSKSVPSSSALLNEDTTLERLPWIPLMVDRLEESGAWEEMEDYQFGWYMKLLIKTARSPRLGYLRLDEKLWMLAGARSKPFFDAKNGVVLARFKVRQFEGQDWIYSPTMLSVLKEQSAKYQQATNRRKVLPQDSQGQMRKVEENGGGDSSPSLSPSVSRSFLKPKTQTYSQADFDERDLRKLNTELRRLYRVHFGNIEESDPPKYGRLNDRLIFETACEAVGISVERGRQLTTAGPAARPAAATAAACGGTTN